MGLAMPTKCQKVNVELVLEDRNSLTLIISVCSSAVLHDIRCHVTYVSVILLIFFFAMTCIAVSNINFYLEIKFTILCKFDSFMHDSVYS